MTSAAPEPATPLPEPSPARRPGLRQTILDVVSAARPAAGSAPSDVLLADEIADALFARPDLAQAIVDSADRAHEQLHDYAEQLRADPEHVRWVAETKARVAEARRRAEAGDAGAFDAIFGPPLAEDNIPAATLADRERWASERLVRENEEMPAAETYRPAGCQRCPTTRRRQ